MAKKTFSGIIFVALTAFLLVGFSESALAAKGIIKGIGTGGGSGGSIAVSDLGITDVGTLPSSKWYFFKEWGRGLERLFTFNSIKKVELELRIANENAAEALAIQETKPDETKALAIALEKYAKAGERLQTQLAKLKETSENPNVEKLLEKLNKQTLKHAILLNQLVERWNTDPYVEDANVVNLQGARDNHLQGAVDILQKKIQELVIIAAEKDKNIEQKAREQIQRADVAIHEFESELAKLKSGFIHSSQTQSAGFAINEPGLPNEKRAINTKGTGAVARTASEPGVPNEKTGPIRLDPTPARIPTNMTIERQGPEYVEGQSPEHAEGQTPKTDFGDRMKAGLETAGGMLANAKTAFADSKFGEAFGQARSAEVLARNGLRLIIALNNSPEGSNSLPTAREGVDANAPRIEDVNSAMPIVPGTGKAGEKIVPEAEKRVFPETNRTAKDTSGYTFAITGHVYDATDAPAMTLGTPVTGIVMRAIGPKTFTTQTRSNGSYTISFTNAPVGTYDVCVALPSGYTMNPPSGCETVTVGLSEKYVEILEFTNNGHAALNGTAIDFNVMRQQVLNECPTDYNPFCGKDGKTYRNACYATKAGVEISYAGECRAGVTVTCDGYNGPMCGYDNKTYPNECEINKANVMVQYVGECH